MHDQKDQKDQRNQRQQRDQMDQRDQRDQRHQNQNDQIQIGFILLFLVSMLKQLNKKHMLTTWRENYKTYKMGTCNVQLLRRLKSIKVYGCQKWMLVAVKCFLI